MTSSGFDRRAIPPDASIGRWQAADGWDLRTFDWPPMAGAARRGSILFQTGRGDLFEKYLETFAHWHVQGWHVSAFDWRGQGGSGRLTPRPHVGHIDRFDRFVGDLEAFWGEWTARHPGPHVAIGHSMGGHLVLRGMAERVITPQAAVLVAPMLGLKAPISSGFGAWLARTMGRLGDPARAAWKGNEKPYTTETRKALLTHDEARYQDELWWQQRDTALLTGPPSWRWVSEAFASTRALAANPSLATMQVPVLMLVADADALVDARAAVAVAGRLQDVRLVRFGQESAHEILREVDAVRDRALAEIDGFLDERAPA